MKKNIDKITNLIEIIMIISLLFGFTLIKSETFKILKYVIPITCLSYVILIKPKIYEKYNKKEHL